MSKQSLVSVIIPNWNGLVLLKKSLPSLANQSYKMFEVIVVDNGSVDGSLEYIKKNFPKFRIVKLIKNFGFAAAVNFGIRKSMGSYIVLINNDTEADMDFLKYLVLASKKHKEVGFIGSKMLDFYERNKVDNVGNEIDSVGHTFRIGFNKDQRRYSKEGYVFLVTGGGSLFKRELFEKVGLFDEDFFAYYEDTDLCLRAQLMGIKGWYEPKALVYHIGEATSSKYPSLKEYLVFKNRTVTIIKNFPTKLLVKDWNWLKITLVHLNAIRSLAQKGYLWSALKVQWYIFSHLRKILSDRKRTQAMKKVTDEYIIENILEKGIEFPKLFKVGK